MSNEGNRFSTSVIRRDLNETMSKVRTNEALMEKVSEQIGTLSSLLNTVLDTINDKSPVIEVMPVNPEEDFIIPVPSRDGSIGYDLVLNKDFHVPAGRSIIPLNLKINLPRFIVGNIKPRSGYSAKGIEGVTIQQVFKRQYFFFLVLDHEYEVKGRFDADVLEGTIDPGYNEPMGVIISNHDMPFTIKAGTHIAQMTFYNTLAPRLVRVDQFTPLVTNRGGGFGHSTDGSHE